MSSRDTSRINYDIATEFGIKVSVVAILRRKLKQLLHELDQSTPLAEDKSKDLIVVVLSQEQTTKTTGLKGFRNENKTS